MLIHQTEPSTSDRRSYQAAASEMEDQQKNTLGVCTQLPLPNSQCYEFCYRRVTKSVGNMAPCRGSYLLASSRKHQAASNSY